MVDDLKYEILTRECKLRRRREITEIDFFMFSTFERDDFDFFSPSLRPAINATSSSVSVVDDRTGLREDIDDNAAMRWEINKYRKKIMIHESSLTKRISRALEALALVSD